MNNFNIIIPNNKILLKEFNELAEKMIEKILFNALQIQTLKTTRDTLLPKLMSGEIRVEGFGE